MYALDFVAYLLCLPRGNIQIFTNCWLAVKCVHREKTLVNEQLINDAPVSLTWLVYRHENLSSSET